MVAEKDEGEHNRGHDGCNVGLVSRPWVVVVVVVAAMNCCLGLKPWGGLGWRSPCRWGCTHFPCPTLQHSPSSPSPRGQYLVLWAHLPTQSGLSSCHEWCWWGRKARALSRSGLLARVPEVGALCLLGEGGIKAGRDGAGLPQGQANPVNPVLSAQPFSPFPPQCCFTLAFNW